MKCKECVLSWVDEGNTIATCHADPNWSAPCEYDDNEGDE